MHESKWTKNDQSGRQRFDPFILKLFQHTEHSLLRRWIVV